LSKRRLRLRERGDKGLLINYKQQIAFFHPPAIFERLSFEHSAHPGPDFHSIYRFGLRNVFVEQRHRSRRRLDD
jgi:hypothetical protein